jgi:hypothetical protein
MQAIPAWVVHELVLVTVNQLVLWMGAALAALPMRINRPAGSTIVFRDCSAKEDYPTGSKAL